MTQDEFGFYRPDPLKAYPLDGDWTVTYGSFTTVRFSGFGRYTVTAWSPFRLGNTQHHIPAGTVLARLSGVSSATFVGDHAMFLLATGEFARWSPMTLQLLGANRLTGTIRDQGKAIGITFDRVSPLPVRWV